MKARAGVSGLRASTCSCSPTSWSINSLYLLFSVVAFFAPDAHRRRWTSRALDTVLRSPATPPISLIVPAYGEETTIADSLRGLLLLNYPHFEVVVINDGSKDRTLDVAIQAFGLMRAPVAYQQPIETAPVRGLYRSLDHPDLVMIDKANGGKADAINAGLNAARHDLVCVIDADSLLEELALARGVLPFIEDPYHRGRGRGHPHRQRLHGGCGPGDEGAAAVELAGAVPGGGVPAGVPERPRRRCRR